ncbi:MAG TPA: response regulator, partial [Candidatus Sumerlaeota bacterium]|nr:response regulator [Candidatus Sumerlaeota bacterium]
MNISILIIDDEAKMGKALRHVLLREGYNVDICDNPQKGLEIFEASTYHLVLCDLLAWRDARAEHAEVLYWRTAAGEEVDFVIEAGRALL